jgi:dTDP-4-dehydrorhamnose reductase
MILVTGNGNLANELKAQISQNNMNGEILSKQQMDITDKCEVFEVIKNYMMKPDYPRYLIHTAAITKPTKICDINPILSIDTNIVGTSNVAEACNKYGIKFIYISSDFVYPPNKKSNENDAVGPTNGYGWSKLGGECVTRLIPNSLILRCALCDIPFRHEIAFKDVFRNSIKHSDAAKIILSIMDETGVINVGGECMPVYDFVSKYQKISGKNGNGITPSVELDIEKLKELINE